MSWFYAFTLMQASFIRGFRTNWNFF